MWGLKKEELELDYDDTEKISDQSGQSDQSGSQTTNSSNDETSSSDSSTDTSTGPESGSDSSSESDSPSTESSPEVSSESSSEVSSESGPETSSETTSHLEHDSADATVTDPESQFSTNESLLSSQSICKNDPAREQELLPPSEVTENLTNELQSIENDQISDINDSIISDKEFTITEMFDSLGDKETVALDFRTSDEQEGFDSTEVPSSEPGQVQQLLLEPIQEQEEQEQLTDDQTNGDTSQQVEVEQELQSISEEELAEQEQLSLEIQDSSPNITETLDDQIIGETDTQEKYDQLVRDYQVSLEQRAVLEEETSSEAQQEVALDQQTAVTSDNVITEVDQDSDSDVIQQEGGSENTFTLEQEEPQHLTVQESEPSDVTETDQQTDPQESIHELERPLQDQPPDYIQESSLDTKSTSLMVQEEQSLVDELVTPHVFDELLPQNDFPSYFSPQETVSTQLFSELCLMEDTLESTSTFEINLSEIVSEAPSLDFESNVTSPLFQDLEPEFSSIDECLSSMDSPRLLEQFHTEIHEETTQLVLIDDTQSLLNLEDSLELVSEGPTIPDPPPYDFLQDLEEQEEANQRSSSTRSHLLWSLQQARLKQEVANYQFALRNLPTGKNQLQRKVQKADRQKSPSSSEVKVTQPAPSSSKTTGQHEEASSTLDKFLLPQTQTPIQRYEISSERGIWGHFAIHIPLLGRAGTDKFLDSLIQNRNQENDLAHAIVDKCWSTVRDCMLDYADQRNIILDPQIIDTIIDWSKNELSIKLDQDRRVQEGRSWSITRYSTQQENLENITTEIIFKPTGWGDERFKEVKTVNISHIDPQIRFDKWLFRRYDRWIQGIHNADILVKRYDRLLLQDSLITEYDNVEDPLFKMSNDIYPGKESYNRQFVKLKLNNEETKIKDIKYKDLLPYELVEIRVQLKSHWDSSEITGSLKTHVREDFLDKLRLNPSEKDIEEFIGQERILEGIITLNSEYKEGDSIFVREQVRTDNLTEIPENISNQFGKSDPSEFRQPDFLIMGHKHREISKISQVLIDIKKSEKAFKTNNDGYGRGQPFRDGRWSLYVLYENYRKYFPDLKKEDIEVSYYILTAEIEDDNTIVIKGEELIRDVPSTYVYPNTGIIIKNDKDVYKLIKHIRYSYTTDSENSEEN